MSRDESMDIVVICDSAGKPSSNYSGHWYGMKTTAKSLPIDVGDVLNRYVPHSQLVEVERQLAERETQLSDAVATANKLIDRLAESQSALSHEKVASHNREGWLNDARDEADDWRRWATEHDGSIGCNTDDDYRELIDRLLADSRAEVERLRRSVSDAITFLEHRVESFEASSDQYKVTKAIGINEALMALRKSLEDTP